MPALTVVPVLLQLAADVLDQYGHTQEAGELRAIVARSDSVYAAILAREQARPPAAPPPAK